MHRIRPNPPMIAQTTFDPMLSIFDSAEEEAEHTAWLRAKLQASIDDPSPRVPHAQVMAEARAIVRQIEAQKAQKARA